MKKRIFATILILAMVFSLAACGGTPVEDPSPTPSSQAPSSGAPEPTGDIYSTKAKIMVVGRSMTDAWCSWMVNMAKQELETNYPNVEFTVNDLGNDPANIVPVLDQCVLDGYDGILIQKTARSVNSDAWYQAAAAEGLKICGINAPLEDGVSSSSYALDFDLGKTAAENAAKALPQNAKVVFFKGPDGNQAAMDRVDAYEEFLFSKRPDIEILASDYQELWKKEIAIQQMEDWCQLFPTIDGIVSVNDGFALGALDVMKNDGRDIGNLFSCGIDGLADGCLSIEAGELTTSVLQDADEMARGGLELLMKMITGEIDHDIYELTGTLITSDNVDRFIQMHKDNGIIK